MSYFQNRFDAMLKCINPVCMTHVYNTQKKPNENFTVAKNRDNGEF